MSAFLCPLFNGQQLFTDQGVINAGGLIYSYLAGTTTPQPTYTDSTGGTPNPNPIVLNSAGRPPQEIWMTQGTPLKFVVQTAQGVQVLGGLYDNVIGINDTATTSVSEWVSSGLSPTYISTTSFSVPGNQTGNFQVGRRLQMSVTANTVYGYIASAVYTSLTTVTMTMDTGQTLNSGLSSINYGLLGANNVSVPLTLPRLTVTNTITATGGVAGNVTGNVTGNSTTATDIQNFVAFAATMSANLTSGTNTTLVFDSVSHQTGTAYNNANGIFTAPVTGWYRFEYKTSLTYVSGTIVASGGPMAYAQYNGSTTVDSAMGTTGVSSNPGPTAGGAFCYYMTAGDTMRIKQNYATLSTTYYLTGGSYTTFSGSYLGA